MLINSEQLYFEANKQYFKKYHNFEFTKEHHRQGTGKKFADWIKIIVPTAKTGDEILSERNIIFYNLVRERLTLLDGAEELLKRLHKHFKRALVTSSRRDYVDLVFEKTDIAKYFDLVVTGEMVTQGKPDPECYLLAAKKLKVSPLECLVFEDAPSGILAGKNAGMTVIAVPSMFVKGDKVFKKADWVCETLNDITIKKFIGLA